MGQVIWLNGTRRWVKWEMGGGQIGQGGRSNKTRGLFNRRKG